MALLSLCLPVALAAAPAPAPAPDPGRELARAAARQIGVTVRYDPSYVRLAYPGGDPPADRGVCTDVVVRACRARGLDLQVAVHEALLAAGDAGPLPRGRRLDASIDHRRVPVLSWWFTRHWTSLSLEDPLAFRPGDVVTWRLPGGLPHMGLVAEVLGPSGRPAVIHNVGSGVRCEDALGAWPLTGHWRRPPAGR